MNIKLQQYFAFRPVGQGLFAHGSLRWDDATGKRRFNWLYDCGTSSSNSFLQDQIDQYVERLTGQNIHLAALSHYDQDHVCGIGDLIRKQRIETLVLPYIHPTRRLVLLSQAAGKSRDYQRFLASPGSYLLGINGDNLGRVIFITPGGESPRPPETDNSNPRFPWPHSRQDGKQAQLFRGIEPSSSDDPDLRQSDRIHLMTSGEPFGVGGLWEFCFYNRKQPEAALQSWWTDASPAWDLFQASSKQAQDYEVLIDAMRRSFASHRRFLGAFLSPNEISLFMYSGPVFRRLDDSQTWNQHGIVEAAQMRWLPPHTSFWTLFSTPGTNGPGSKLFSGDITMTEKMAAEISNFLGNDRWSNLTYFQVPHHGARRSWRAGVYENWPHRFSIFSAQGDDGRFGHPHTEVVEALDGHGPIHVNIRQGFASFGSFQFT